MNSKSNDDIEYVYTEDYQDNEDEYVYSDEPESDDVEYVLANQSVPKDPRTVHNDPSRANKPGHCRTEPNLYDELDYEISPRETSDIRIGGSKISGVVASDSKKNRRFTVNFSIGKKALVVGCIVLILFLGAVIKNMEYIMFPTLNYWCSIKRKHA